MGERQGQHELHSKSKKRDSLTRPGAATITSVGGVIRQVFSSYHSPSPMPNHYLPWSALPIY